MIRSNRDSIKKMELMSQTILDDCNKIINLVDNRDREIDSLI